MEYDTEKRSMFKKAKSLQKSLSLKKTKDKLNLFQEFTLENPDLREIYIDECLSDNDELHLLKVPLGFDTKSLVDNFINFDEKTKLNIENVKYIIEPSKEKSENVFMLSRKPKLIHSTLILRKKRRKNRNIPQEEKLPEIIIEDEPEPIVKKKKRKIELPNTSFDLFPPVVIDLTENGKHKKNKTGEVKRHENEAIFDLLESYTDQKKKSSKNKKDKVPIAQQSDSVETRINNFIDSLSSKKKKRKRKSKDKNKTNPVILQNILLSPSHGNESSERIFDQNDVYNSPVKKKSKKKSSSEKIDETIEHVVTESIPKKKKAKKRNYEVPPSTTSINEEEKSDNIDVTDGTLVEKKKKKKKQNTESPKLNININNKAQEKSTNLNVSVPSFVSPKENKNEKKILISEILNSVKKQIHFSPLEKKRRKSVM